MSLLAIAVAAPENAALARERLGAAFTRAPEPHAPAAPLAGFALELSAATEADARAALEDAFAERPVDWCVRPADLPAPGLVVCDMDSTIIGCECVDELADMAGKRAEVSAVTEAAMRGELEFEASLIARVKHLTGLPLETLERVWRERVRLNPGAGELVGRAKAAGAFTALVSGGFTYFTERVAEAAGFDAHQANVLIDDGARLTGAVRNPILGRAAKRAALERFASERGVAFRACVAVGDGANDLDMMAAAGLSIAYMAKPAVAAQAHGRVVTGDLRAAAAFFGAAAA